MPPRPLFQYLATTSSRRATRRPLSTSGSRPDFDPTYTYDAATRTWKRTLAGAPFTAQSGQQVAPTNVIVQFTNYEGGAGSPTAEGQTVGTGDAWVFTDGKIVRGRWTRPATEQPAQFVDAAGKPIKLLAGPDLGRAAAHRRPGRRDRTTAGAAVELGNSGDRGKERVGRLTAWSRSAARAPRG